MQGIVGTMPWVAMGFTTLYLQLLGFSDIKAATLVALFGLGCALGSFGGGYIGASLLMGYILCVCSAGMKNMVWSASSTVNIE